MSVVLKCIEPTGSFHLEMPNASPGGSELEGSFSLIHLPTE